MAKNLLRKGMSIFKSSPNYMKVKFLKKFGSVDENLKIGKNTVVYAKKLRIGKNVTIGANSYIVVNELILNDYSTINSDCKIDGVQKLELGEEATIAEKVEVGGMQTSTSNLIMGKRSVIFPHCFINTTKEVKLGQETCIGGYSVVMTHSSWSSVLDGYPVQFAPVTIGDNVYIPWKVFILPGVTIGDGAVIGAGSLVTKDVLAKSLAVGMPAKIIKKYNDTKLENSKKIEILKSITKDLEDYLINVKDLDTKTKNSKEYGILTCKLENNRQAIFLFTKKIPEISLASGDIVVSLNPLPNEKCNEYSGKHIYWIDLENKKGWINREDRWAQWIRGFLVRYGIRVDSIP